MHVEINTVPAKSCGKTQNQSDSQLQNFKFPHKDRRLPSSSFFNRKGHFRVRCAHSHSRQKAYKFHLRHPESTAVLLIPETGTELHPKMTDVHKIPDVTMEGGGRCGEEVLQCILYPRTCTSRKVIQIAHSHNHHKR